jgi:molecular chaperone GrpE
MKPRKTRDETDSDLPGDEPREESTETSTEESTGTQNELETLVRERNEYLASWKRATADYQNLRRRLQSDLEAAVARQRTGILADLLLVLDYLDLALATPVRTDEGRGLHTGVDATRTALLAVLEREGVRPVETSGAFDPTIHECVARSDAEGVEPGAIVAVLRPGYTLDGKMLRPAQVKVAGEVPSPAGE